MSNRYVYMLYCADGTYYTGITTDLERRLCEHNSLSVGAVYTKSRRPVMLVRSSCVATRNEAAAEEWRIKKLNKQQKMRMMGHGDSFSHEQITGSG